MDSIKSTKLNKIHYPGVKKQMENFENKLSKMITDLKTRAEREVCEYGNFKPVSEIIKNSDKNALVQDLTLKIETLPRDLKKDTENYEQLRYLKLVGNGSQGQEESVILKRGTKKEILEALNNENILARVKDNANEMKISFAED